MYSVNIILFDDFELLDAFGPAEIFSRSTTEHYELNYFSEHGGLIESTQKTKIETKPYQKNSNKKNIVLIPGGAGTRPLVDDSAYIEFLQRVIDESDYVLSVCTGSALLAKTNVLDGKSATSNKRAFEWAREQNDKVNWIKKARWTKDGHIYTSSGISAGMDMTLGFIKDLEGEKESKAISQRIEYIWNDNCENDPFSDLY